MTTEATQILDSLSTAVLVADPDFRLTYVNMATEQLLGTSRSRLRNLTLPEILNGAGPDVLEGLRLTLRPQDPGFTASEVSIRRDRRPDLTVDLMVSQIPGPALLVEMRSSPYHNHLRQDLDNRYQHLAARDLIRSLAHEIKNPLGGIRGAAQLIDMTCGSDHAFRDYTTVIIEQADRLKSLVDRLLGPQRPNPVELTNIHFVIEKVLSLFEMQNQGRVGVTRDYDPSLPELPLDVDGMQQTILNIVNNAFQALTGGECPHPRIVIRTRAAQGMVINGIKYPTAISVSIINNGPPIPQNIRETVFYPMVTTKYDGSGLGLSIAQSIVERHHGSLSCDSNPERTEFRILLPWTKRVTMSEVK